MDRDPSDIIRKMIERCQNQPRTLAKILRFKDERWPDTVHTVWNNLLDLTGQERAFKIYVMSPTANIFSQYWMDKTREKLVELFYRDAEYLLRLFHHLDRPNCRLSDWDTLKAVLGNDHHLRVYAHVLVVESREANHDRYFRATMKHLYHYCTLYGRHSMEIARSLSPASLHPQDFPLYALARTWTLLPLLTLDQIQDLVPRMLSVPQSRTAWKH